MTRHRDRHIDRLGDRDAEAFQRILITILGTSELLGFEILGPTY